MKESRDPFEGRLASDLSDLADTAVPGRRSDLDVAAVAMAADHHSLTRFAVGGGAAVIAGMVVAALLIIPRQSANPGEQTSPWPASTNLEYACGTFAFPPTLLSQPPIDLKTSPAGGALAAFIDSGQGGEPLLPREGWHLVLIDDSNASFIAPLAGDPPYAEAQAELGADGWRIVGWGQCRPTLRVQGVNGATWNIVPGQEIDSTTQAFMIDVTESACASGKSSADRLRTPIIVYEPDRVVVTFAVDPLPDGDAQDCQGNPPTRVRVELAEPLGDRKLFDGGTLPWHDPASPAYDGIHPSVTER
jgi:hypothetical protein